MPRRIPGHSVTDEKERVTEKRSYKADQPHFFPKASRPALARSSGVMVG